MAAFKKFVGLDDLALYIGTKAPIEAITEHAPGLARIYTESGHTYVVKGTVADVLMDFGGSAESDEVTKPTKK